MMESRSSYGYYGWAGGVTGENEPKRQHKSGWRFSNFYFAINDCHWSKVLEIKACDYAHAVKQAKKYCKDNGFVLIGDAEGYERQINW